MGCIAVARPGVRFGPSRSVGTARPRRLQASRRGSGKPPRTGKPDYAYCIPRPFVVHNLQPKGVRVSPPIPSPASPHRRLRAAREQAGFARASDAARAMGIGEPTYLGHENGSRGLSRAAARYARFFHVSLDWLIGGRGEFRVTGGDARLAAGLPEPSLPVPPLPAPPRNAEV